MARQGINIGVEGNDGTGDSIRESFKKTNENFTELYAVFGQGGQISFTTLSDTPNSLTPNTIPLVDSTGGNVQLVTLASNNALDSNAADTITFSYSQSGKLIISSAFTKVADDTKPQMGGPLDALNRAIGNVSVSEAAVTDFNNQHGTSISINDLVISKGYADTRYISSNLPIRLQSEPANATGYTLTISRYVSGNPEVVGHGYDTTINGLPFKFIAEDTEPTNLDSGTTYFLRYKNDNTFTVHATKAQAIVDDQTAADTSRIFITGSIASDDVHSFVDAGYDSTLEGFYLSDVGVPRDGITRRQGDTMTGALTLHDHPGDLAGLSTNKEDLQAATKFYVDNTSYSSPENLFVSTTGDDTMAGVPPGKEGTSYSYAFRTVNAAARRAEELIKTAPVEAGPYFQTITKDNGATNSTTTTSAVNSPVYEQARKLIDNNRTYLIDEVSAFIKFTYPNYVYNTKTCKRDLGKVLDAIALDINRGLNANFLTRLAAERYYSGVSGRKAITSQLTETVASFNKLRDFVEVALQNTGLQQKNITDITEATIPVVTTSTDHGLVNGNQVRFASVTGMTEINNQIKYVKVLTPTTFEIFTDSALTTAYDTSGFTNYVSGGTIDLRYQSDESQYFDTVGGNAGVAERGAVVAKFNLLTNIIQNGIDVGADVVYGSTFKVVMDNGGLTAVDQGKSDNVDILPGKVIVGKRSGAIGRVVSLTTNDGTESNNDTIQLHLLEPIEFEVGEEITYGNYVKQKQITIHLESGFYDEDYPIKIAANVSIKGDEFRRVIIRPKNRISQSKYANTYFYRDKTFDGLTLASEGLGFINQTGVEQGFFGYHYSLRPDRPVNVGPSVTNVGNYPNSAFILQENKEFIKEEVIQYLTTNFSTLVYNETKCRRDTGIIVDGLSHDLTVGGIEKALENQGEYYSGALGDSTQEVATEAAISHISTLASSLLTGSAPSYSGSIAPDLRNGAGESGTVTIVGNLIDTINFAFNVEYNPPLRNDEMDVFMMNDATILRNITVQGHGGFMLVLDPDGQVLTKSPYIQTGSSFSKSENKKIFAGGIYCDAFVGNLPISIETKTNNFRLNVRSPVGQGLRIREPQLPCPFYIDGRRYQVNAISDYDSGQGTATLYLDAGSNAGTGYDESQFDVNPGTVARDVFLQTAGNRSILGNDFTQINDLGYGLVCNNGAFSEMVSMFTYYCQAAYYANNGSEIRSLNGSNGYGNFGLIAEGADPNEVPDQVILLNDMVQPVKAYTDSTYTNAFESNTLTVTDAKVAPTGNSKLTIHHGGSTGSLDYIISQVTNLSDVDGDGTLGEAGDIVVTGINTVTNISGADAARTPGTYDVSSFSVTGSGQTGGRFQVTIDGTGQPAVTVTACGEGYAAAQTVTVAASQIGGTGTAITFDVGSIFGASGNVHSNAIYKLDLRSDDIVADNFFGTLRGTVTNNSMIEFKHNLNQQFERVNNPTSIVTRPSTAINFDESDDTTYRSIGFSATNDVNIALQADEIQATFETNFEFINLIVSGANIGSGNGSAQGNTSLAIAELDTTSQTRLLRDIAGLQPGAGGYAGGMIFTHKGKTHQVTSYTGGQGVSPNLYAIITFTDVSSTNISSYGSTGLAEAFTSAGGTLLAGLPKASTAEITIAISLLRATGHDFTQIGTGSYNDSNYPNVILGDPENNIADFYTDSPTATSSQVWERRKGRVFFVSTDQFGFFRVGKFFSVDQATGDISFAGEIGITNANSLGFKKGVTINEFSSDDSFADDSGQAVPTEKAVASYLTRRLGLDASGNQVQASPTGNRLGTGVVALNGITEMEGDLQLGSNKIINVALPGSDGSAATNKNYVDSKVQSFDEIEDLRNVEFNSPTAGDILVVTGKKRIYVTPPSGGTIVAGDTITVASKSGTVVDIEAVTDSILGSVSIITYTPVAGVFANAESITNSTATATIVDGPVDEVANAPEDNASDVNISVTRDASGAKINLQLEANSVLNADVSTTAAISQSKLNLQNADTFDESSATTGWSGSTPKVQADLGLAKFSDENFETSSGYVRVKEHGIIFNEIQEIGSDKVIGRSATGTGDVSDIAFSTVVDQGFGLQDNDFTNSEAIQESGTVLTLVGEVSVVDGETITQAASGANGVVQGQTFSENKIVLHSVSGTFNSTNQLSGSSSGALGSSSIPSSSSGTALIGKVLIQVADGVYGTTSVSVGSTTNTIARRNNSGHLQAEAFVIGGTNTQVVLSESGGTLSFKTPAQGTILEATGTNNTSQNGVTVNMKGNLDVGETGLSQGVFQGASTFNNEGYVAADWMYTNFIESANESAAADSTGISIGNGSGFAQAGAGKIVLISDGVEVYNQSSTGAAVGGTFDVSGIVNLNATTASSNSTTGALIVDGGVGIASNLNVGSNLGVGGTFTVTSNATVNGTTTLNGNVDIGNVNTDSLTITSRIDSNVEPSTNNARNMGASGLRWNTMYATTFNGVATTAQYADLAEKYIPDMMYEPGTVLIFGGSEEVTTTQLKGDPRVAGVVSTNPAYLMNSELQDAVDVALAGRVPCKVLGVVKKGDILISAAIPGYAVVNNIPDVGTVIGKALQDKPGPEKGTIEIAVGKA